MGRYHISYNINIRLKGKEEIINLFCDALEDNNIGESWDYEKQKDEKYGDIFVVTGQGWEEGKYYPGKIWGPPENCYPDDYDYEEGNFYEGDLDDYIVKFETDYEDDEFFVIGVKVNEDWDKYDLF